MGETIPLSLLVEGGRCFVRGNFGVGLCLSIGIGSDGALLSMVLGSTICMGRKTPRGRTQCCRQNYIYVLPEEAERAEFWSWI